VKRCPICGSIVPASRSVCSDCAREERQRKEEERQRKEAERRLKEEERRAQRLREEEERRAEVREEELALIARAKSIEAERKHQAEVAWAKRVVEEEDNGPAPGRSAIPKAVKHAVWIRDSGKCTKCGSREALEYDHVIPVAMGGSNTERNLRLLCERCNRRKGKSLG
jgi:HNH endonuclease